MNWPGIAAPQRRLVMDPASEVISGHHVSCRCALCLEQLRARVIAAATTWLGTPFVHGQSCKGAGVDCAWLLIEAFHAAGLIPRVDPGVYPRHWFLHRGDLRYVEWLRRFADPVTDDPQPADVALFRIGRAPAHAALVVAWPQIIHVLPESTVRYAQADNCELSGRLHSVWRCRGL